MTDEWGDRGVKKGQEYAILTDEITRAWSGFTTKQYKAFKELKKENLRDHMSNLELVLNMLAEATTTEISKEKKPVGFENNRKIAKRKMFSEDDLFSFRTSLFNFEKSHKY